MSREVIRGRQVSLVLTNKSGGDVAEGDVVILSSGSAASFTTTTSAGQSDDLIGVALETIINNADGRICIQGYVRKINLSSSASLGDYIKCHSVAGQGSPSSTIVAGVFAQVLGTGTTPAATLWGTPYRDAASLNTAGFTNILKSTDTSIQTALETLSNLLLSIQNEVMNFPATVGIDIDLVAQNQWWDSLGTPTTACTMVDIAGEAGITETYEYALKCVVDAADEGLYQRYTYVDQPRIKSGRALSGMAAIWVATPGVTVTMKLNTSGSTNVLATATAGAWTIVRCNNLTLDGTYVDLQFYANGAGTFYVVPLGLNIGHASLILPSRAVKWIYPTATSVKTLTGIADEATWTDVDITASSNALACEAKLRTNIMHTNATGWDLGLRRNGDTTGFGAPLTVNALSNANTTERSIGENFVILDDAQIFEYYLDRWTGSSTLADGYISLVSYGVWE